MLDLQGKVTDKHEKFTVYYHNLFDFPLTFFEMLKWTPSELPQNHKTDYEISSENGYYYLTGGEGLPYKRTLRQRISKKKMLIAQKASELLSKISAIKMVAVSGSLAMQNAVEGSDVDLLIITKTGRLWQTRALSYLILKLFGFQTRKVGDSREKDRLCLNMWFDESDLIWRSPRNLFTAHEIAQLIPLVNKDKVYEKFILKNKWVRDYWPNAIKIVDIDDNIQSFKYKYIIIEKLAFWLQYLHMKRKMTREIVTPTRAIFHPQNWTNIILKKLAP